MVTGGRSQEEGKEGGKSECSLRAWGTLSSSDTSEGQGLRLDTNGCLCAVPPRERACRPGAPMVGAAARADVSWRGLRTGGHAPRCAGLTRRLH